MRKDICDLKDTVELQTGQISTMSQQINELQNKVANLNFLNEFTNEQNDTFIQISDNIRNIVQNSQNE